MRQSVRTELLLCESWASLTLDVDSFQWRVRCPGAPSMDSENKYGGYQLRRGDASLVAVD